MIYSRVVEWQPLIRVNLIMTTSMYWRAWNGRIRLLPKIAQTRNQHPVEVMLDLMLENDNQLFVQLLVNELPADVLGMLRHPCTLATFSDTRASSERATGPRTRLIR